MSPIPDESPDPPSNPATPRRTPKNGATATTPATGRAAGQAGATPKSAPAAAGQGNKRRPESLLVEFILGRPLPMRGGPARPAPKPRRKSVAVDAAAVKEELRQQMRAAAVERLQKPGGVHERVKAWQKTSVEAMKAEGGGIPMAEDVASEPTEVAAHIAPESVTEEDRMRIKFRQKPKRRKPSSGKAEAEANRDEASPAEPNEPPAIAVEEAAPKPKERPKKRIVSDDNWMKRNKGKGAAKGKAKPEAASPTPIPKDFLQRTAQNPTFKNKIKDWATRVEVPDNPPPLSPPNSPRKRPKKSSPRVKQYHTKEGDTVTVEEDPASDAAPTPSAKPSPAAPLDDGIRVKPLRTRKPKVEPDDGIRVKPLKTKTLAGDDGIRVRPTESSISLPDDGIRVRPTESSMSLPDDGIRVRPTESSLSLPDDGIRVRPSEVSCSVPDDGIRVRASEVSSSLPDDGIRVRPSEVSSSSPDDGIRVRPSEGLSSLPDDGIRIQPGPSTTTSVPDDGIRIRPGRKASAETARPSTASSATSPSSPSSAPSRRTSREKKARIPSARREPSPGLIEVVEEPEPEVATPTRKPSGRRVKSVKAVRKASARAPRPQPPPESAPEAPRFIPRVEDSDDESRVAPTLGGNKSLADIPVGYSAFSVLDLPMGADAKHTAKRQKAQRTSSFKTMPEVFKKVMSGAKEIITERAEPPRPAGNKPPSIETWLNGTVDPFVESPQKSQQSKEGKVNNDPVKPLEKPQEKPKPQERPKPEEPARRAVSQQRPKETEGLTRKRSVSQPRPKEPMQLGHKRSVSQPRPTEPSQETPKASKNQARRSIPAITIPAVFLSSSRASENSQENTDPEQVDSDATPKKAKHPAAPSTGLKRRRATRSASSPVKANGKKPFREVLKDAFRGESGGHKLPPMVYPSCETELESPSEHEDDEPESKDSRRQSTGSGRRSPTSDLLSTLDSTHSSDFTASTHSSDFTSTVSSHIADPYPSRRKPPTNGHYELSTIISGGSSCISDTITDVPQAKPPPKVHYAQSAILSEGSSSFISDTASDISQTTVTQATALTKSTEISRNKSHKSHKGSLKRRLTKHSDLVSVLSLPDTGQLDPPARSRSIKSAHSLHRKPSKASRGKIDELLEEFADDEYFYGRELKTLVDGVVPVLLRDAVRARSRSQSKSEQAMSKSVVNMGMTLERLRNLHRCVPLSDIRHLLTWLETVAHVYDDYLDVWRLGFQGLIVNLAPSSGRPDDEDSLLNALPRNEDGDVLGEDGERVDVAYLLKRPLIRVKWMTKFLKAAVMVVDNREADGVLAMFETLQEKARTRHREEIARITDEDANNTDTTRARDLRNLAPLDGVRIDRTRQVAAKDSFELDLDHSSGQRIECQVEVIHRDRLDMPSDKGDILIREMGDDDESWLLFPPIPRERTSARRCDGDRGLLLMVRGAHNKTEWFELLKLSTGDNEQILDWLDILGSYPLPPLERPSIQPSDEQVPISPRMDTDVPLGERRLDARGHESPNSYEPSRHRTASSPTYTPQGDAAYRSPSPERPPTRESYGEPPRSPHPLPATPEHSSASWNDDHDAYEEPLQTENTHPTSTPYREDGAPPPPVHRILPSKSTSQQLSPPVDLKAARIKRRGSSPLKHEYHPSDVSSTSSSTESDSSDSSESSSDELDEDDVPDTIPGYSIKMPEPATVESVVSEGSIAPSQSASQVEPAAPNKDAPVPMRPDGLRFMASVSYWSAKKGLWKDVSTEQLAVVVYPGSMAVHRLEVDPQASPLQSSGTSEVDTRHKDAGGTIPLVGLVLTPVVMIRRSTALDLEVRSPLSAESRLQMDSNMFRFRAATQVEAADLYRAVHISRLNNARFIQLSEEARVRSFGQPQNVPVDGSVDGSSSRRRSFFGRKNSYRASTRAPSASMHSGSTTISAASFLRRLTGGYNTSFNIDESSMNKQSRPGSVVLGSLDSSSGSSAGGGGGGAATPPQSLSISLSGSGQSQSRWSNGLTKPFSPADKPFEVRCHLNVVHNRWADKGDCVLHIGRPPPGVKQELSVYHGMEKRIMVTRAPKKSDGDAAPAILLDAVLGSKCFSMLGTKGIMCSVWENLRDEDGNVGIAPAQGGVSGRVTKWCFQCKSRQQADWIMSMVTSEVPVTGLMGEPYYP